MVVRGPATDLKGRSIENLLSGQYERLRVTIYAPVALVREKPTHAHSGAVCKGGGNMDVQRRGAAIEIVGLRKQYGRDAGAVVALADIDLTVAPGEFVCIVGPSGCGKSTLLRILAGLDQQTGGTIKVAAEGWAVQNAMVFQDSGLFPWMNVETNVGFGLMTRGVPAKEAAGRVEAALKLVGLTRFRRHYPHQLSGGMRQRSAIARAFVTDPAMLLMDEPFAALDAQNRTILQAELVRLWEETRKTVIYITHSIEEALALGDRTVVMTAQPGRIKQIIDVPFPHPRNLMTLSASPEFGQLKLDIWRVLEDEVNRARAEAER
jgi:NitT/TauT family transport system ATP-binding protein